MYRGQKYRETFRLAKTRKDAEAEERIILLSIDTGEYAFLSDKTLFSDFVEKSYLPYMLERNVSITTKQTEIKHLNKFFGKMMLKRITPETCEKFKQKRKSDTKHCQKCENEIEHDCKPEIISPSTVNRELTTLSKILKLACRNRKIKSNPMEFIEKFREPESRERFLTQIEKDCLLEECRKSKTLLALVLIGLLTGWRKGQILSLSKSAMNADERTVLLIRSKQQKPRKVAVSDLVWNIFEDLAKDSPIDYLFYNPKTLGRLKDFTKRWKTALDNAGIKDFKFHDIRHCAATDLKQLGTDVFTIKTALGHSKLETTLNYAHTAPNEVKLAMDEVSKKYEGWIN